MGTQAREPARGGYSPLDDGLLIALGFLAGWGAAWFVGLFLLMFVLP